MDKKEKDKTEPIVLKDSAIKARILWTANEYAKRMNKAVVPLLRELGLKPGIKALISYCAEGGKHRLQKVFYDLSGADVAPFMQRTAEKTFNTKLAEFPQYGEFLTDWDSVALLELNENGEVWINEKLAEEAEFSFLRNEASIETFQQIQKVCDSLNDIFSKDYETSYDLLNQIFYFDIEQKKFVVNTYQMTDISLHEIKFGSNGLRAYESVEKRPQWFKDLEDQETKEKEARHEKIKKSFGL